VFLNSLNDTVLNVTGIRNNIINYGGNNYIVEWFARLNVTLNAQPKNTTVNMTDYLGNAYLSNASVVNGLTSWIAINDFQTNNTGTLNFNPYTVVFGDPTTIVANITQTETINVNLNPNQTNLTASIQPSTVSDYGSNQVTSVLYINNTLNATLNLTCTPTKSWLSANCSSTIDNNTNSTFTVTVTPNFGSSGVYTASIIVQGQNGSGDYYSTITNLTVQYTAPVYGGGGGGYVPPAHINQTVTPAVVSNATNATLNVTNVTPPISISNASNATNTTAENQTFNITPITNPTQNKSNATATPTQNKSNATVTPTPNWFDQIKNYYWIILLLIIVIAAVIWFLISRPKNQ
jgi:hypothetical protein